MVVHCWVNVASTAVQMMRETPRPWRMVFQVTTPPFLHTVHVAIVDYHEFEWPQSPGGWSSRRSTRPSTPSGRSTRSCSRSSWSSACRPAWRCAQAQCPVPLVSAQAQCPCSAPHPVPQAWRPYSVTHSVSLCSAPCRAHAQCQAQRHQAQRPYSVPRSVPLSIAPFSAPIQYAVPCSVP